MGLNYLDILIIIILLAFSIKLWNSKDWYSYFLWTAVPALFVVMPFISFAVEVSLVPEQQQEFLEGIDMLGMHIARFLLYWSLTFLLLFTAFYRSYVKRSWK